MHIAIDARIINSSTGRYVERLLHYLEQVDKTNDYTVLVRAQDETFWTPTNDNFRVRIADFDNYSWAEQTGFKRLLDDLSPDLVHFCMPQQPVLYKGRMVTTIHDLTLLNTYNSDKNWFVYRFKQLVGRFVFKRVARRSDLVLCGTEYVRKSIVDFAGIPENKVIVTPESADTPDVKPEPYDELVGENYIMYVGSQSDYKNIRRLMLAHQELLTDHPDLKLVLVGKTTGVNGRPAGRNQDWATRKRFKNIVFTGFVPDEKLSWLYNNTAAYVFPSLSEGFGLPGLEAMLHEAPVVSSNATCLPEVYGAAAEYFDPTSVDDMTAAIRRVIDDTKRRDELIKAGHKQAKKYSWRRMAEQTHQAYMTALKTVSK
jgi:glycosyltransferase involved in cell wall biosynthesis